MNVDVLDILTVSGVLLILIGVYGLTLSGWITMIVGGAIVLIVSLIVACIKAVR